MAADTPQPIAIVGIGCRLPGDVYDTESLWEVLATGRNTWSPVPTERFNEKAFYHPDPDHDGTTNHRGGHFLSQDVAAFDAGFFGVSPNEARAMDPQQRLLLEVSYEAFENAGLPLANIQGTNTSVHVAMFSRDYDRMVYKDPMSIPKYQSTGTGEAILSNRISYLFNLKGPSMTLDTGCSGSLVALHQACQSLRTGETDMALVCGVSLILGPEQMIGMSNLHMLNDDGRCYAFDARGSGYGRGEGVTSIVLKRFDDAVKADDNIRALIPYTSINQDGKTNGITLPSSEAQESLTRSVYRSANIDPRDTAFVEAHGTSTVKGDEAEMQSIANVFSRGRNSSAPLYVGSIKSNIGHTESVSGLAGLIKTVVAVEKGYIPPNADFRTCKPSLDLDGWGIKVPTELTAWPVSAIRQASVNSFGYGGVNAHAIIQGSPSLRSHDSIPQRPLVGEKSVQPLDSRCSGHSHSDQESNMSQEWDFVSQGSSRLEEISSEPPPRVFVLSATSAKSLRSASSRFHHWMSASPQTDDQLDLLATTLCTRRSTFKWRQSFVAASRLQIMERVNKEAVTKMYNDIEILFVFTGQGAQWFAMGRELYRSNKIFRESMEASERILYDLGASWSLSREMFSDESTSRINDSEIAQPASTALQIAICSLLASVNIRPRVVIGHSSGEIAAAVAAGAISHQVAITISYFRSQISGICKRYTKANGAMLSVGLSESAILPMMQSISEGTVCVACVNSPVSVTISGDEAAIEQLAEKLNDLKVFNRRLKVDTAYHSHHMQLVADHYLSSLGSLSTKATFEDVIFVSTVTAKAKSEDFGAAYWVSNLTSKVRFSEAVEYFRRDQSTNHTSNMSKVHYAVVEVGPHGVLGGPIRQTLARSANELSYSYLAVLSRGRDSSRTFLETAGKMFELGLPVDLDAANSYSSSPQCLIGMPNLPSYPWDHNILYWHESRLAAEYRHRKYPWHDLCGLRNPQACSLEPSWSYHVGLDNLPWLAGHKIDGLITFPGASYICMAIEALIQITSESEEPTDSTDVVVRNVDFIKALVIPPAPEKIELQLCFRPQQPAESVAYDFRIYAITMETGWREHCRGKIETKHTNHGARRPRPQRASELLRSDLSRYEERCPMEQNVNDVYKELNSNGNSYESCFAAIRKLNSGDRCSVAHVLVPDTQSTMPFAYQQPHILHPSTLDALLHTALPLCSIMHGPKSFMPSSIEELTISPRITSTPGDTLVVATDLVAYGTKSACATLSAFNQNQDRSTAPVVTMTGARIYGLGKVQGDELHELQMPVQTFQMRWSRDLNFVTQDRCPPYPQMTLSEVCSDLRFKNAECAVLQIGLHEVLHGAHVFRELCGSPATRVTVISQRPHDLITETHQCSGDEPEIEFKQLDLFATNSDQDFLDNSFDMIVSPAKLEVISQEIDATLRRLTTLLKVGGILIFPVSSYLEDYDAKLLHQDGLVSLASTFLISRLEPEPMAIMQRFLQRKSSVPRVKVVAAKSSMERYAVVFATALKDQGIEAEIVTWSCSPGDEALFLVFDKKESPFLTDATSDGFRNLTQFIGTASNILWVSLALDNSDCGLESALITGLGRTACAEHAKLKFVTLDVQERVEVNVADVVNVISHIILTAFGDGDIDKSTTTETEYVFKDGRLLIPRLVQDNVIHEWLADASGRPRASEILYHSPHRVLNLLLTPNAIQSSTFEFDRSITDELSPDSVEVAVNAHALSVMDIQKSKDQIEAAMPVVREFAGIITSVGTEISSKFSLGDRVCGWTLSSPPYANIVRIKCAQIARLPGVCSMAAGAALPIPLMSAYYTLIRMARLHEKQSILIHGAADEVGHAAILISKSVGAHIIIIASNDIVHDRLIRDYQIPQSDIFIENTSSMQHHVREITDGRGVDLILSTHTEGPLPDVCDCLVAFGTIIHINYVVNVQRSNSPALSSKPSTFISFDLTSLLVERPDSSAYLLSEAILSLPKHDLQVGLDVEILPISQIADAWIKCSSGSQTGKIVLEANEDSLVTLMSHDDAKVEADQPSCDEKAVYLVAGGLGDLGRQVCRVLAGYNAKNIVILSRSTSRETELLKLESELRQSSPDIRIFSIACDISDRRNVAEAAIKIRDLGFSVVKGLVQAAAVLNDRVLEGMSWSDFQIPLATKLRGTKNLVEIFDSPALDFMVILSSLSGLVGTRGQANYAAGNAYQDAIAQRHTMAGAPCIALDLGMIEDTQVYEDDEGKIRKQNLIRMGLIPVKSQEVFALLQYALSPEARSDGCRQAMIGIDGKSIHEAANSTPAMKSAMFVHVRHTYGDLSKEDTGLSTRSAKAMLVAARNIEEANDAVVLAICERMSTLVALDRNEINQDMPIVDFGLDSLGAIEIKNWFSETFDANVQASEILDEASIASLGAKVTSRSGLVPEEFKLPDGAIVGSADLAPTNDLPNTKGGEEEMNANGTVLPKQPLPDLESTIDFFLTAVRPITSTADYESTVQCAYAFQEGEGRDLQQRLINRVNDPACQNWQRDLQVSGIYLRRRDPIHPYGTFWGSHLDSEIPHTQAERASIICTAALLFKKKLNMGQIGPEYMNEERICSDTLQYLFNKTRKPRAQVDEVCNFPDEDYIVVMCRGHLYKVTSCVRAGYYSDDYMMSAFEQILTVSETMIPSVAALTAENRDTWAGLRAKICDMDPGNRATFDVIDAAAFVVCLDDSSPVTAAERATVFQQGRPSHRWSDKTLQFVICRNGSSAFICEHSMLDAASMSQLNRSIAQAIATHIRTSPNTIDETFESATVQRVSFAIDSAIEQHIARVDEDFAEVHGPVDFHRFTIDGIGKEFFRSCKISVKTAVQLIIQLARYQLQGDLQPSWETFSMMPFRGGRLDWMQVVSSAILSFCNSTSDATISREQRSQFLREAATVHSGNMSRIARGRGYAAHLEALREVVGQGEPVPEFFQTNIWQMMCVTSTRKMKTDASEGLQVQEGGFYMPDPESLLVHYEPRDDECLFFVQGGHGHVQPFCGALDKAASTVKDLLSI